MTPNPDTQTSPAPSTPTLPPAAAPLELIPAQPEHLDDLARICHLAFNTLQTNHRVPLDVPDAQVGQQIIGGVLHRPDYAGIVAVQDGKILGSNFLLLADEVCGVGPITVDPDTQSRGVGRQLMQWAIDEAHRRRGPHASIRLFQEAVNTTSLSLYTRLGFQWRDAAVAMHPRPADADDASVRPMTADDLPAVAQLSEQFGGYARTKDAAQLLNMQFPAFVRERNGRIVAYQIATLFGHAAAETNDDLLALTSSTARHLPPPVAVVIVPMSQTALFAAALNAGFRVTKVLNYMSIGPYKAAPGPALPSIQA